MLFALFRRFALLGLVLLGSLSCDAPSKSVEDSSAASAAADSPRLAPSLAKLESLSPVDTAAKEDYFRLAQGMPYGQVTAELGDPAEQRDSYTYHVWSTANSVAVIAADSQGFVVSGKSGVWQPNGGDEFLVGTDSVRYDSLRSEWGEPDRSRTEDRYHWQYSDGSVLEVGVIDAKVSSMAHYYPLEPGQVPAIGGQVPGVPAAFNPVAICDNNPDCQENLGDIGRPPILFRFRHAWKQSPQEDCELINQASQGWVSLYHLVAALGMPDAERERSTRYVWNRGDGRFTLRFAAGDDSLQVADSASSGGSSPAYTDFQSAFEPLTQSPLQADNLKALTPADRMELVVDYSWDYTDQATGQATDQATGQATDQATGQAIDVAVDRGRVVGCNGVR